MCFQFCLPFPAFGLEGSAQLRGHASNNRREILYTNWPGLEAQRATKLISLALFCLFCRSTIHCIHDDTRIKMNSLSCTIDYSKHSAKYPSDVRLITGLFIQYHARH